MKLLELFSGTGSVKKAVGEQFTEIISIDILQKYRPTECIDILKWDYKKYEPNHFDAIWASPPCTEYSVVSRCRNKPRNIELANQIVQKTIEIINYFKPKKWFIENPQTGMLKDQIFMNGLPFVDVDYCQYGFPYRKRTRIWTNVKYSGKLCDKKCGAFENGHHKVAVGNSRYKNVSLNQRYSIPSKLIQDLFVSNTE